MPNLTIRNIDADTHAKFKALAERSGRSMEAQLRHMIARSVSADELKLGDLAARIRARMEVAGGGLKDGELVIPPRVRSSRTVPKFD